MTAVLFDGFDHGDAAHRWTQAGSNGVSTSPVRTGTHSYLMSSNGNLSLALAAAEEDDVMYVGFGYYGDAGGAQILCSLQEGFGAVTHVRLSRNAAIRGWSVELGSGATLIPAIPNVWFPNSWHHIEFGAKVHASTGWVELRQDGATIGRFDGDTDNGGTDLKIDQIDFNQDTNQGTYNLDDVHIVNEQGSVNNTWLGDTRCFPLYPIGNGFYLMLLGSDGNSVDNYLLVDEAGTPVTTDYVGSTVVGDKDTYEFQDLAVTLGTIRGIEARMHAAKDDTGTKQARIIGRRSGSDFQGVDKVLAAIPLFQTHHEIFELDPLTAAIWTIANVNATEWGAEVRT